MVSVFDLFKIGIGPSSSHTTGPMRAAAAFRGALLHHPRQDAVTRVRATLFGSLAWTGKGHASDKAVALGLAGWLPETVDPDAVGALIGELGRTGRLPLEGGRTVAFAPDTDIVFDLENTLPRHPNAMSFTALAGDEIVLEETWYSIGGGFVVRDGEEVDVHSKAALMPRWRSANELLALCEVNSCSIAELVFADECALRPREEVEACLDRLIAVMFESIERGMRATGKLPGSLGVQRRARVLLERLDRTRLDNKRAPHDVFEYVNVYAIAVNEENAAGGRIVTAPTNGAAGVVPAVMKYFRDHCPDGSAEGLRTFVLTAAAIGALCKTNASISGAEIGCQGEVGVACAMAAAGLTAALGGSDRQVENAAEIGIEHHLGMTCDPVGGLVQIPCIERNAFGAVKAINAASLALRGDGEHVVTLDEAIETMRQTGVDMQSKYKETSRGGLAVNVRNC